MKPTTEAPAIDGMVDGLADSELDTHLDTDVDLSAENHPNLVGPASVNPNPDSSVPAPRTEALPVESGPTVPADPGLTYNAPARPADPGLTEREREILAFERRWWKHAGAKEQAIRDTFDLTATRYYQLLNGLIDNPAALAAEPMLVGRLQRLRSSRSRSRRR